MERARRWLSAHRRGLGHGAALVVLALVFAAYLNPHRLVELAGRVWACF